MCECVDDAAQKTEVRSAFVLESGWKIELLGLWMTTVARVAGVGS
jgi:hypothetical protein